MTAAMTFVIYNHSQLANLLFYFLYSLYLTLSLSSILSGRHGTT
jgi:hypothetical protein